MPWHSCSKGLWLLAAQTRPSPNRERYLTRLGMNQEKSNLASSPARLARLEIRMSWPLQCAAKASSGSMFGPAPSLPLPPAALPTSCQSTRLPSHCANTTNFARGQSGNFLPHPLGEGRGGDLPGIAHQRQCGQRRERQSIRAGADKFGLQADQLGCAQQVGSADGIAARNAQLMRHGRQVGADLVETRDGAKRSRVGGVVWVNLGGAS